MIISGIPIMGILFTGAMGNVLTKPLGNILTELVGKVLDIYTVPNFL